jgi:hypothetical protein
MREEEVDSSRIPTLLLGYVTDRRRPRLNNKYMTLPMISFYWHVDVKKEWRLVIYSEA